MCFGNVIYKRLGYLIEDGDPSGLQPSCHQGAINRFLPAQYGARGGPAHLIKLESAFANRRPSRNVEPVVGKQCEDDNLDTLTQWSLLTLIVKLKEVL